MIQTVLLNLFLDLLKLLSFALSNYTLYEIIRICTGNNLICYGLTDPAVFIASSLTSWIPKFLPKITNICSFIVLPDVKRPVGQLLNVNRDINKIKENWDMFVDANSMLSQPISQHAGPSQTITLVFLLPCYYRDGFEYYHVELLHGFVYSLQKKV